MTLHLKMPSHNNNLSPRILVIGVGGAGGNIINSMIESGIEGVDFLNVNTDSQQLKHSKVEKTLQLGPSCTEGLGAGADPELGKKAAEEVIDEIEQYLQDANMVFLTAGMGGGTGTGASPVIARVAKEKGILTVGVVTKPFEMEGNRKINRADEGVIELQRYVDNLIVIPNQNIFHLARPDTPVIDSLQFANDVLIDGVKSIIDLMVKPGIMNHDFADVKAIMSETGKVHLGTGISEGEDRINAATDRAISNPLLENNTISGAKGVLINISCGNDTSLHEVETAVSKVKEEVDINANLIWGIQQDDKLDGKFRISVIATGIESESYYQNLINSNNSNEAVINEFSNTQIHDESLNQLNSDPQENSEQNNGFKINLHESEKSIDDDLKDQQKMIQDENIKVSKKTSLFSKIFGKNTKVDKKIEEGKVNFFDEIREISEENGSQKTDILNDRSSETPIPDNNLSQLNNSQSNMVEEDKNIEINGDKNSNEINDDLLQIPAFLRRQAN
jgi:cell division protein FtsZ